MASWSGLLVWLALPGLVRLAVNGARAGLRLFESKAGLIILKTRPKPLRTPAIVSRLETIHDRRDVHDPLVFFSSCGSDIVMKLESR